MLAETSVFFTCCRAQREAENDKGNGATGGEQVARDRLVRMPHPPSRHLGHSWTLLYPPPAPGRERERKDGRKLEESMCVVWWCVCVSVCVCVCVCVCVRERERERERESEREKRRLKVVRKLHEKSKQHPYVYVTIISTTMYTCICMHLTVYMCMQNKESEHTQCCLPSNHWQEQL